MLLLPPLPLPFVVAVALAALARVGILERRGVLPALRLRVALGPAYVARPLELASLPAGKGAYIHRRWSTALHALCDESIAGEPVLGEVE